MLDRVVALHKHFEDEECNTGDVAGLQIMSARQFLKGELKGYMRCYELLVFEERALHLKKRLLDNMERVSEYLDGTLDINELRPNYKINKETQVNLN